MKHIILLIFISVVCLSFIDAYSFKKEQLKYATVSTAYAEKWSTVKTKLTKAGIDTSKFEIFIRVFKHEGNLEVWARSNRKDTFKLVDTYEVCSSSGSLGPKRKEGDGQVPEGFYHVSVFQPASMFYLALGVSYPNKADLIKGNKSCPGGNIMIHGNCVTIGCMPMTDDKIKEIYIMAVEAYTHGEQTIPIHIFPTRLNDAGMAFLKNSTTDQASIDFWNNLKTGYTYFEAKKRVPLVNVNDKGDYTFE
ncbi:MAG TPA: L,D-transpeptidase family protein [Bacteroidia bacterium]|jgi:murein L,D-transpeptidase YafK|nr:L,D-transpeptidase family protein [Bacteroidia bacterium]